MSGRLKRRLRELSAGEEQLDLFIMERQRVGSLYDVFMLIYVPADKVVRPPDYPLLPPRAPRGHIVY
ncbi:unnamed protein product [Danaus chrysippus]|uniref:(African queen) hypothetical protein n=1 Tax=Danaus chrysippus TaxID=151541 RepID=A0A8J2QEF2_9NEOP|nr:unnamed protein product [Danaus chrysippus]